MKKITTEKEAIEILVGAGIIIDKKNQTQTWRLGQRFSQKVIKAGAFLDHQMQSGEDGVSKPAWKTKWLHRIGCTCPACLYNHKLIALRPLLKPQYSKPTKKQHHKPAKKQA